MTFTAAGLDRTADLVAVIGGAGNYVATPPPMNDYLLRRDLCHVCTAAPAELHVLELDDVAHPPGLLPTKDTTSTCDADNDLCSARLS